MHTEIILEMVFQILGGLGIFLLGMRNMSEGLQVVAGTALKKIIGAVTNNRFMAVGVGVLVTSLVQSSSITTVMVVGFVNSGLMTLYQAIGVIMGANIGTTITGWILALKIGKYGLPLLGAASFVYLFSRKEKLKYIALAILGIGMVFFGLELMSNGFKPIRAIPEFEQWFHRFDASTYIGVLQCALVGCILTLIVQSSSATLGITIALASQGVIDFSTAAALVMGENVGTTITAYLASLGAGVNAKRSAYFHMIFNVLGVAWITAIFSLYLPFVQWVIHLFAGIENVNEMVLKDGVETFPYITAAIALVHSIFNVTNVILFLPLTHQFEKLLIYIVKEKPEAPKGKFLTHLDFGLYDTPFAAFKQSEIELVKMGAECREMMDSLKSICESTSVDSVLKVKLFKGEDRLDYVQQEITEFITDLLRSTITYEDAEKGKIQLRQANEFESISDYVVQILKLRLRLEENERSYSLHQKDSILRLHDAVIQFFDCVLKMTRTDDEEQLHAMWMQIQNQNKEVTRVFRELRADHWGSLASGEGSPLVSTSFADTLSSYRKIKDHLINIAESISGERQE
jgi:phosphate:Na+ symporter